MPDYWPIDSYFDEGLANDLARLESFNKHIYRPNNYLHKWWARRCGTTFRLILKHLSINQEQSDYYETGGLSGKIVLDPMMGGGTILHEAIRLGANVIGFDIDPIPVLQAKASLSATQLEPLNAAFSKLFNVLSEELLPLFKTECPVCSAIVPLRYTLYGLLRRCSCRKGLFLDSKILRKEADGRRIVICDRCHWVGYSTDPHECPDSGEKVAIFEKDVRRCDICDHLFVEDLSAPYYLRYSPVATVAQCPEHGLKVGSITEFDIQLIAGVEERRKSLEFVQPLVIEEGSKSSALIARGIHRYEDLFSSRQLMYVRRAMSDMPDDEITGLFLGLLVSTSLEFNSMLCGYKGVEVQRSGAVRHVFSHHAYSFPYTALENNPVFPTAGSGNLLQLFRGRIERGRNWARAPRERSITKEKIRFQLIQGETDTGQESIDPEDLNDGDHKFLVRQGSADGLGLADESVDFVITDPPYFDSLQYHDLAAFFRVWLEKLVPASYQEGIDWRYRNSSAVVSDARKAIERPLDNQFTQRLTAIFLECKRVLKPEHGRLIFTFHHWKPIAWNALSLSLRRSGFYLISHYVVHSENPTSVHINKLRALTHDVILVLGVSQNHKASQWHLPADTLIDDSEYFCRACGQILGFLLESDYSDERVWETWREKLETKNS